jgi:hypothetical protein
MKSNTAQTEQELIRRIEQRQTLAAVTADLAEIGRRPFSRESLEDQRKVAEISLKYWRDLLAYTTSTDKPAAIEAEVVRYTELLRRLDRDIAACPPKAKEPPRPANPEPAQRVSTESIQPHKAIAAPRFPNRANWLRALLAERHWSPLQLEQHGGPNHKTTKKILNGANVTDGVLDKLATALSDYRGSAVLDQVSVCTLDIPRD